MKMDKQLCEKNVGPDLNPNCLHGPDLGPNCLQSYQQTTPGGLKLG